MFINNETAAIEWVIWVLNQTQIRSKIIFIKINKLESCVWNWSKKITGLREGPVKKKMCVVFYFFCLVGLFWCRPCSFKQHVPILCVWYAFYWLSLTGYTSQATCRGSETWRSLQIQVSLLYCRWGTESACSFFILLVLCWKWRNVLLSSFHIKECAHGGCFLLLGKTSEAICQTY